MWKVREEAGVEVQAAIHSGIVKSFEDWPELVRTPIDPGKLQFEGAELEAPLADGEVPWLVTADGEVVKLDDMDVQHIDTSPSGLCSGKSPSGVDGASAPVQTLEELARTLPASEAVVAQARKDEALLAKLQQLRKESVEVKMPVVYQSVDRRIQQLERGQKAETVEQRHANTLMNLRFQQQRDHDHKRKVAAREVLAKERLEERRYQNGQGEERTQTEVEAPKDASSEEVGESSN
jgi:hypothetical protein